MNEKARVVEAGIGDEPAAVTCPGDAAEEVPGE